MQTFTVYGPSADGNVAYGPSAGGTVAYGTATSGVEYPPQTGYPMSYPEIIQYVTASINDGSPEQIIEIITPEHVAIVQACGIVTNPNPLQPMNVVTPVHEQIDALLTDLDNLTDVGDALALFNATNAGAADLYAAETDRVGEHEGETSSDDDVADVISDIDDITIIKNDSPC